MKRKIFLIVTVGILVLFAISQWICFKLDDDANEAFKTTARQMQIKGKTKDYVSSVFGQPSYKYKVKDRTMWVYTPGPIWTFWRHECKVSFDSNGLVDGWAVRLD